MGSTSKPQKRTYQDNHLHLDRIYSLVLYSSINELIMKNLLKQDQANVLLINALSEFATLQGNLEQALKLMQEIAQEDE